MNRTTLDSQIHLSSVRQPLRGPFALWPRASDAVLATVVFLWSVFASFEGPDEDFVVRAIDQLPIAVILVFAVASGALYWRRSQPLVVLGINFVAWVALLKLGYPTLWAMPFALYSVGRYATNDKWSYYAVGAAIIVSVLGSIIDGEPLGSIGFVIVFVFMIWYIGRRIQARGVYLSLLQEHAVAEERTRIARELHDIVAHRVTLMTVQAGAPPRPSRPMTLRAPWRRWKRWNERGAKRLVSYVTFSVCSDQKPRSAVLVPNPESQTFPGSSHRSPKLVSRSRLRWMMYGATCRPASTFRDTALSRRH